MRLFFRQNRAKKAAHLMFIFKTVWFLVRAGVVAGPFLYLDFGDLTIPKFAFATICTPILLVLLFNPPLRARTALEEQEDDDRRRKYFEQANEDDMDRIRQAALEDE